MRKTATSPDKMFELAEATEHVDPDRAHALARYLEAARAGHRHAQLRARTLALSTGAYMTTAELALDDREPLAAGEAFLDAGFPELAVDPLKGVIELHRAAVLFAIATKQTIDADAEISRSLALAKQQTGRAAAPAFAHAARIAALSKLDNRLLEVLAAATRNSPDDEATAMLVESRLLNANRIDELLAHYRSRFESAGSPAQQFDRMHNAGTALLAKSPGLALRMLRMSLETAYVAKLPSIPHHLAIWESLAAHARAQQTSLDLVPLIVQALESSLSDDAAVYLSRLGLEIVWKDGNDTLAAQPYAATLLDFVPDHPLATAFTKEIAAAMKPTELPPAPAPPVRQPSQPHKIAADDTIVKRSVTQPNPQVATITGRLALLKPPSPRATSLRRDTSPFPMQQTIAKPRTETKDRAPRKVVPVDAIVQMTNGQHFATVLRDVSTSGAFVMTKRTFAVGDTVQLEMKVPLPNRPHVQTTHRTTARIARITDVGCGLAYVDPPFALVDALRATTE